MAYKRPDLKKPDKPHGIEVDFGLYGFLNTQNDPGWITPHLADLHDEARFGLHQFSGEVTRAKDLRDNDLRPEVLEAKRAEMILKAKRALMSFLKKHISKSKTDIEAAKNAILRATEPPAISDPTRALLRELKNQEIRNLVRNTSPKDRHDMIAGNLPFIQALIDAPDDIISKEHLTEIRRAYAFQTDPTLAAMEKDTIEIYKATRRRAGDISATSVKMLIDSRLDDPTPPAEFYEVFQPESDHEKVLAQNRIQRWERKQTQAERVKEFDEKQSGVNLQAGERAIRIDRGIQH